MENTSSPNQNVMGYRGKLTIVPSESHLVLAEIPLLYNDRTEKFGLGDIRGRYFYLPYKNYDKFIGTFGPSVDVIFPTGSFENGLGSGRFTISPGILVGLMAAEWIQFYPIVSYQYASKPTFDNPAPEQDKSTSGLTVQIITPIVFSSKFFVSITPIYRMNDLGDNRQDRLATEFVAAYALKEDLQLSAFYNGNFKDEIHQMSLGVTVFL